MGVGRSLRIRFRSGSRRRQSMRSSTRSTPAFAAASHSSASEECLPRPIVTQIIGCLPPLGRPPRRRPDTPGSPHHVTPTFDDCTAIESARRKREVEDRAHDHHRRTNGHPPIVTAEQPARSVPPGGLAVALFRRFWFVTGRRHRPTQPPPPFVFFVYFVVPLSPIGFVRHLLAHSPLCEFLVNTVTGLSKSVMSLVPLLLDLAFLGGPIGFRTLLLPSRMNTTTPGRGPPGR